MATASWEMTAAEVFYQSLEHGVAELHTAHTRSDIVQFVHDLYESISSAKKKTGGDTVLFVIKNLQFLDLMQTMLLGDRVDEAEYIEFLAEPKAVDVLPTVVEDPTLDLLAGFSAEPTDSPVEPTGFSTKPADDDPFAALLAQVPSLTADVAPAESQNVEERDPFADLMASFSSIGADSSHVSAQPVSGAMGNASEKIAETDCRRCSLWHPLYHLLQRLSDCKGVHALWHEHFEQVPGENRVCTE